MSYKTICQSIEVIFMSSCRRSDSLEPLDSSQGSDDRSESL